MASVLWTDIIDPATLTGYARASLEDYEVNKPSLARFLPNRNEDDIVVRFDVTQRGLVPVANFRAYDAEPEIGKTEGGKRVTIELPALGMDIPVSELDQLRQRSASEEAQVRSITRTTSRVVRAIADRMEYQRAQLLLTGKFTVNQDNFKADDDFGRDAGNSVVAGTLWTDPTADRLEDLQSWVDTYEDVNGETPGVIVMTRPVFRAFAAGDQFQTQLVNGGGRRPTDGEVRSIVEGAGLPPIEVNTRKVSVGGTSTPILGTDKLLLLPEPVDPNDAEGTDLGATMWGHTLTADDPEWAIADVDRPGIVTGVYRNKKPPMIAEVVSDAIGMPFLANANLSFVAEVL